MKRFLESWLFGFICGVLSCIFLTTQDIKGMWSFTIGFVFGIAFVLASFAWHLRPTQKR